MSKRCRHMSSEITWRRDTSGREYAFARHCHDCHAQISLGPSNETPAQVAVEIRAAELSLGWEVRPPVSADEYAGWLAHFDNEIVPDSAERMAGWLSREILRAGTERDIGDWPWDPTRPVAGQRPEPIRSFSSGQDGRLARVDRHGTVVLPVVTGPEPEPSVELEVAPLPTGSHDRVDCPCGHPPGEVGPCGRCSCADGPSPISDLIARSSIGAGLADIEARGIDAHLVDLDQELSKLEISALTMGNAEAVTCRRCMECVDQEHHWMENDSLEDEGDPWFMCKHCSAYCDEIDDEDAMFAVPSGVVRWWKPRDHSESEHSADCDTQTDPAFPCNAGRGLGVES